MVRSRIGSPPPEVAAASDETIEGTQDPAFTRGWLRPPTPGGTEAPRAFFDGWVAPLCARTVEVVRQAVRNGSLTLGCLLALGGCAEPAPRVDVAGVVIDDRTGAPVAGARVSTDDGFSAETDDAGRFEISVEEGEQRTLTATAEGHAPGRQEIVARADVDDVVVRLTPTSAAAVDAPPLEHPRSGPPTLRLGEDDKLRVESCAPCHDAIAGELSYSSMGDFSHGLRPDDPALRPACASCHAGSSFVASRSGRRVTPDAETATAVSCGACHEPHADDTGFGLRVDDTSDPIAGSSVPHLGSGALCASCHRATDDAIDAAPHAPQADVLVGRGARSTGAIDGGSHRHIADTCTRCHMTRPDERDRFRGAVGGHTFAVRNPDATMARSACAPCHGETPPSTIGARDWNGDGVARPLADEHDQSMARARAFIRREIASLGVHDTCPDRGVAVDVTDHDARMSLIDAAGRLLGDCDGDRRFTGPEAPVTTSALPPSLAASVYDVLLLQRDGSSGAHNPDYAFRILRALNAAPH